MRDLRFLFAFAGCLVLATSLDAATISAPLNVDAEVVSDCVIATSNLAFGTYDPLAENATKELDGAAQVTVLCTRSSRVALYVDGGRNSFGNARTLVGSSQRVSYQLFRDADRTQEWSGADGLQFVSGGIFNALHLTVYGRIPPGQQVASGVYVDVVTATMEF